jgi:hypothetical protein
VAFRFTAREIAMISRCGFRPKANPTRQLTGLRPKPEQPKRQRPKQQRQSPKRQQPSRSQQQPHPMQQQPNPKQRQPVPKRQLRR